MAQILFHVAAVVFATIALKFLRLDTKSVVHVHSQPVSWVWKAMALTGKLAFYYGLFVFISNLWILGTQAPNTGMGAFIMTSGLIFWIWGGIIIYFKKN